MSQARSTSRSRRTARSRCTTAALVVVLGLLMAGCQGEITTPSPTTPAASPPGTASPSPSESATPTEPSTPEPSPASSAGPAANILVPQKPPLADENSVEGLEAFTEYWFELLNYAYITNDWTPFEAVTDPGCDTCTTIRSSVEDVYKAGRWIAGAEIDVVRFASEFEVNTSGSINSYVENQQGKIIYFESDGTWLGVDPKQSEPSLDVVIAVWDGNSWLLLDYGRPEGT